MTDRGDRFVLVGEVFDDFDHTLIQPQVLRRAAAGKHNRIVFLFDDPAKVGGDAQVMSAFFAIGLLAFKVMNRRGDRVPGLLVWANGGNLVAGAE